MTFNMYHGGAGSGLFGHGQHLEQRFELVADVLRRLRPDVIGLQEASVGRDRGNLARRLAERLGFEHVHALSTVRALGSDWLGRLAVGAINFGEGPAVLSRYPIVASTTWDLPRCGRPLTPRILLQAELETPWGRVGAFSTHTAGDPCQTRRVAELVTARRDSLPMVLMGDFNAVEGSAAITTLTDAVGFIDAFRAANPTDPGHTVWQRVDEAGRMVRRRVDYVFLVPGRATVGRVRESRVVLDTPGRVAGGRILWPSDHYGVLADLEIVAAGPGGAPR